MLRATPGSVSAGRSSEEVGDPLAAVSGVGGEQTGSEAQWQWQDEGEDELGAVRRDEVEMVAVAGLGAGVDSTAMLGALVVNLSCAGSPRLGTYRGIVEWWGRLNVGIFHVILVMRAG